MPKKKKKSAWTWPLESDPMYPFKPGAADTLTPPRVVPRRPSWGDVKDRYRWDEEEGA